MCRVVNLVVPHLQQVQHGPASIKAVSVGVGSCDLSYRSVIPQAMTVTTFNQHGTAFNKHLETTTTSLDIQIFLAKSNNKVTQQHIQFHHTKSPKCHFSIS